jgi:hypothetical protein
MQRPVLQDGTPGLLQRGQLTLDGKVPLDLAAATGLIAHHSHQRDDREDGRPVRRRQLGEHRRGRRRPCPEQRRGSVPQRYQCHQHRQDHHLHRMPWPGQAVRRDLTRQIDQGGDDGDPPREQRTAGQQRDGSGHHGSQGRPYQVGRLQQPDRAETVGHEHAEADPRPEERPDGQRSGTDRGFVTMPLIVVRRWRPIDAVGHRKQGRTTPTVPGITSRVARR